MRKTCVSLYVVAALALFAIAQQPAAAAGSNIVAYISTGMRSAVEELIPAFEKASGHKVMATWAVGAGLNKRIADGEIADLLISNRAGIDSLIKSGKILAASDVELARSGIAMAVRKGAPKPDISTREALKRTLLASRAIAYSNPAAGGASGVYFATVLERLGIADQMKTKTKFPPPNGLSGTLLVSGEVDLAVQQTQELASVEGTELIGSLPPEFQLTTSFVGGVTTTAKDAEAAKAFLRFLQSPPALAVMKAKRLDAPAR